MKRTCITENFPTFFYRDDIIDIIQPLTELLGINYFSFRRIYNNGNHIVLTNFPPWVINYYKNAYFNKKEVLKTETCNYFQPVIWDYLQYKDPFSIGALAECQKAYDLAHSLSLKYMTPEYMDLYSLAAPSINESVNEKYLNYYESIKKFAFYFQSKAAFLINQAELYPIITAEEAIKTSDENLFNRGLAKFEQQILLKQLNLNLDSRAIKLTPRETQCIKALKMGFSSKDMALNLGISPRTVEVYINNLKIKLGVSYKPSITAVLNNTCFDFNLIK
jgi:DNA-binding CsgD family transcriptional regulator